MSNSQMAITGSDVAAASGEAGAPDDNASKQVAGSRLCVRPAGSLDVVPLQFFFDTALRRDYFLKRGQLAEMLSSRRHQVWVAEVDGILLGAAITTQGCRLVNVLVHPGYRGLGIGRELVRSSGATEVRAKLDLSTGDPRGFYGSLGFRSAGRVGAKGNIELMRKTRGRGVDNAGRKR